MIYHNSNLKCQWPPYMVRVRIKQKGLKKLKTFSINSFYQLITESVNYRFCGVWSKNMFSIGFRYIGFQDNYIFDNLSIVLYAILKRFKDRMILQCEFIHKEGWRFNLIASGDTMNIHEIYMNIKVKICLIFHDGGSHVI